MIVCVAINNIYELYATQITVYQKKFFYSQESDATKIAEYLFGLLCKHHQLLCK